MEIKSLSAEKAAVELINHFVALAPISEFNHKGKRNFQLPLAEHTDENRRREELLPIDKYDWLSFDKMFRPVALHPDSERGVHCKCIHLTC